MIHQVEPLHDVFPSDCACLGMSGKIGSLTTLGGKLRHKELGLYSTQFYSWQWFKNAASAMVKFDVE